MIKYFNSLPQTLKLGMAGLILIIIVALIIFQSMTIISLNSQIETETQNLADENNRLLHITTIKSNMQKFQEKLFTLKASIPSNVYEESIISSIQSSASLSSNHFTKITFGKILPNKTFSEIPVNISFSGTFNNFLELLVQLKNGSRTIHVKNFSIVKDVSMGRIKADLQAIAYTTFAETPPPK